jgi:hypothetical protein
MGFVMLRVINPYIYSTLLSPFPTPAHTTPLFHSYILSSQQCCLILFLPLRVDNIRTEFSRLDPDPKDPLKKKKVKKFHVFLLLGGKGA